PTVDALEPAVDLFFGGDDFDSIDRGGVRLVREAGALAVMNALDLEVIIVERAGEVRRGLSGLAGADRLRVEDDDALAFLGEEVRAREPGDAGADDADV